MSRSLCFTTAVHTECKPSLLQVVRYPNASD
jgi:hypothetical protein